MAHVHAFEKGPSASRLLAGLLTVVALLVGACKGEAATTGNATGSPAAVAAPEARRVPIRVTKDGFEPAEAHLEQGQPSVLEFTRTVDSECLNAVRMPWMKEATALPMNQKVEIPVDTTHAGIFTYACWMNMVSGRVVIHKH